MRFQRDPCQERPRIGTMQELCLCGAEFGSHYNGQCPGEDDGSQTSGVPGGESADGVNPPKGAQKPEG